MTLTEIDLSKNAKDATLTPNKISLNPADTFAFPGDVTLADNFKLFLGTAWLMRDSVFGDAIIGETTSANGNFEIIANTGGSFQLVADKGIGARILLNPSPNGDVSLSPVGSGRIDVTSHRIINAADPVNPQDVVTKAYASSIAAGLIPKQACRAGTVIALPASIYNNGAGGVGATLTELINGALPAQDGVTLVNGDRLLVKNQASALENGIYDVTDVGSAITPFILTRSTDFDGSPANEVEGGSFTFVTEGSTQSGSGWVVIWPGNIVIGTDPINFTQFSSAGQFTAGNGIDISGNTISAEVDNITIDFAGSALEVKDGGITNAKVHAAAAIAYSKLNLTGSIVNADVNAAAAIAYSKLNLTGSIVNADISASAAIASSKLLAAGSNTQVQFNSSGTFGASANFIFSGNSITLNGDPANNAEGGITLTKPTNNPSLGGGIVLTAGGVTNDTSQGGSITLTSGFLSGNAGGISQGGSITLTSGGASSKPSHGGDIILTAGNVVASPNPNEVGGSITLTSSHSDRGGNIFLTGDGTGRGQVSIGILTPNASASLDITSISRGFLPPRMTTAQKTGISSPATGLIVFDTDLGYLQLYNGSIWTSVGVVINFVTREVPTGAIDSVNAVFTLAFTPVVGSEEVYLNGLLQNAGGNDYSISGATITFTNPPITGSILLVTYRH